MPSPRSRAAVPAAAISGRRAGHVPSVVVGGGAPAPTRPQSAPSSHVTGRAA